MKDFAKYTFEIVAITDDKHDITMVVPDEIKEHVIGVSITSEGDHYHASQYADLKAKELIRAFAPDYNFDHTKKIKLKLKEIDYAISEDKDN